MSTVGTLYEETVKRGFGKLLMVQTVTNAGSIDFVAPFHASVVDTYSSYVFMLDNVAPNTDNAVFYMRMSIDNGASWAAVGYGWEWSYYGTNQPGPYWNSSYNLGSPYDTYVQFSGGLYPNYNLSGEMMFANKSGAGVNNFDFCFTYLPSGSGFTYTFRGAGGNSSYGNINGVRFYFNIGLMSGTIRLYGLRKGA